MNAMLQPFLSTALPIVIAVVIAAWLNGKAIDAVHKRLDDMRSDFNNHLNAIERRFDAMDKRFDKIDARLERIEAKLDNHETRLVRLEERTSPLTGVR